MKHQYFPPVKIYLYNGYFYPSKVANKILLKANFENNMFLGNFIIIVNGTFRNHYYEKIVKKLAFSRI